VLSIDLQLEAAQEQAANAAAALEQQQRRRSCASIAEEDGLDLSSDGAIQQPPASQQQQQQQQQQQLAEQHTKPMGIAGSLSAALSNAASGFNLTGPKGDDHEQQQQPLRQSTPPPMSPFALARNFVANREAEAMTRLKVSCATVARGAMVLPGCYALCHRGSLWEEAHMEPAQQGRQVAASRLQGYWLSGSAGKWK